MKELTVKEAYEKGLLIGGLKLKGLEEGKLFLDERGYYYLLHNNKEKSGGNPYGEWRIEGYSYSWNLGKSGADYGNFTPKENTHYLEQFVGTELKPIETVKLKIENYYNLGLKKGYLTLHSSTKGNKNIYGEIYKSFSNNRFYFLHNDKEYDGARAKEKTNSPFKYSWSINNIGTQYLDDFTPIDISSNTKHSEPSSVKEFRSIPIHHSNPCCEIPLHISEVYSSVKHPNPIISTNKKPKQKTIII